MKQEELKALVTEKVNEIDLPQKFSVDFRRSQEFQERHFIQISIGSKLEDPTHDNTCSYLDFTYDDGGIALDHLNIKLQPYSEIKGRGFARKLLEGSLNEIGKELECSEKRVRLNVNKPFWKKLGYIYVPEENYWMKKIV